MGFLKASTFETHAKEDTEHHESNKSNSLLKDENKKNMSDTRHAYTRRKE